LRGHRAQSGCLRAQVARTAFVLLWLGSISIARAQARARGPIGVSLDANLAFETADQDFNYAGLTSASLWYRLRPELALGLTGEYLSVAPPARSEALPLTGSSESSPDLALHRALIGEAFADVHFYPTSVFGYFARASVGAATQHQPSSAPVISERRAEPVLECQLGPELELPLDPAHPRLVLLLRARGLYMQLGSESLFGLGLGGGVEF
jgi:hypothetical protein